MSSGSFALTSVHSGVPRGRQSQLRSLGYNPSGLGMVGFGRVRLGSHRVDWLIGVCVG